MMDVQQEPVPGRPCPTCGGATLVRRQPLELGELERYNVVLEAPVFTCQACGASGVHPVDQANLERLARQVGIAPERLRASLARQLDARSSEETTHDPPTAEAADRH